MQAIYSVYDESWRDIDSNPLRSFEFPLPRRSLERDNNFGGAAEIDGFDQGDPKMPILEALGLERDLEFIRVSDVSEGRLAQLGLRPQCFPSSFALAMPRLAAQHIQIMRQQPEETRCRCLYGVILDPWELRRTRFPQRYTCGPGKPHFLQ